MGIHLRVLSESYPMKSNITGFIYGFQKSCIIVLWMNVALALEGLSAIKYLLLLGYHTQIWCWGRVPMAALLFIS